MSRQKRYEDELEARGMARVHPVIPEGDRARLLEYARKLRDREPTDSDRLEWLAKATPKEWLDLLTEIRGVADPDKPQTLGELIDKMRSKTDDPVS